MDYQTIVEEVKFCSEKLMGFPAAKSTLWPQVIWKAKSLIDSNPHEDNHESFHERIDALHTLGSARAFGGKPAINVFRQVNEDVLRAEMANAVNKILPGNVNHLWGKNDFTGLHECFSVIFQIMQSSSSCMIKKMPLLFLAGLVQIMHSEPSARNTKWWENVERPFDHFSLSMNSISEGITKDEERCNNEFRDVFVYGLSIIKLYFGKDFTFRNSKPVVECLEALDPHSQQLSAEKAKVFLEYLKRVHPIFAADVQSTLNMQIDIVNSCKMISGRRSQTVVSSLKKYSWIQDKEIFVTCFLPVARDLAYMIYDLSRVWEYVDTNGHYHKIAGLFQHWHERVTGGEGSGSNGKKKRRSKKKVLEKRVYKKSDYSFAEGRAMLLAYIFAFPDYISERCDVEVCAMELLKRLPYNGGWGKSRKRAETPSPTASEEEAIVRKILGGFSSEEEENDETEGN